MQPMLDMADCYQLSSHLTWTCISATCLERGKKLCCRSCKVGSFKRYSMVGTKTLF
ncbi:hypothetical protein NC653_011086 [Populus alba x Populus x berolinensis]|nr:hypothetical protein NC653_011086 [Populus alba x Populus x berolinensis]